MSKTFSLSEAQTLLPVLESLLTKARAAAERAGEVETEMQALGHRIFLAGGMHVDIVRAARRRAERDKAVQEMKDTLAEIEAIGVVVQDLEDGLLDFPCLVEGVVVYLCWKVGELAIMHWHEVDAGFEGRRGVDGRFGGKMERERLN